MTAKIIPIPQVPRPQPAATVQPTWVRDLHRAFFAHVSTVGRGKVSLNDRYLATQALIEEMEPSEADTGNPIRSHVADIRRQASLHCRARVVGHVTQLPPPQLSTVMDSDGAVVDIDATRVQITDLQGDTIGALAIGDRIIDAVEKHARHGGPCEFVGIPLALPTRIDPKRPTDTAAWSPRDYVLHLLEVGRPATQLDLIGATNEERSEGYRLLADLSAQGTSPFEYLVQSAVDAVGFVGYGEVEELTSGVDFCVLQALSVGHLDAAISARLHAMVVGPPGSGKGMLARVVRLLQPVHVDIAPGSISEAGLIGASAMVKGEWRCSPGAIPRARDGALIAQDAHAWRPATVQKVASIFQEMMEEGWTRKSTAGGAKFCSEAALLIDLNLPAQLTTRGGTAANAGAIARVRPILSRLDCIIEFPEDAERAWGLACDMVGATTTMGGPSVSRPLQLAVATLRHRHPAVNLSPVEEHIRHRLCMLREASRDLIKSHPEAGDMPKRLVITIKRLTTAWARGQDRSVARPEDVDAIMPIVERTVGYLLQHETDDRSPTTGSHREVTDAWLLAQRGERSASEWTSVYWAQTGREIHPRTMQRVLLEAGARAGHGRYCLPPSAVHPAETEAGLEMDKWTDGHRRSRRLFRPRPASRARPHRTASAGGGHGIGRKGRCNQIGR